MRFILACFLFILCFCHLSCRKDVEAPAGVSGANGKNASPVSTVFNIDSSTWVMNADLYTWSATVANSQITSSVVQNGIVKIYLFRSTSWWELPYTESREALTQYWLEPGKIMFFRSESHGAAERPQNHTFKLVISETNSGQ